MSTLDRKAARNERRKVLAAWFNSVSVAALVAGLLQPILFLAQQSRSFTLVEAVISFMFLIMSASLALSAQAVADRVED
jgi:uncharacterized membrane protein